LNLDSLDGLEISDETHAQLNSYLVKSASHGLDYLSPVVRDFLALQKMKEVFNDAKDNAAAGLPHPTHPTSEVQVALKKYLLRLSLNQDVLFRLEPPSYRCTYLKCHV
jgi:hypothetical protein